MSDLEKRQKVYDYLKRLEVKYTVTEHPAVFSIDEIKALKINLKGDVCKNLFLRDSAGKRHFLVTMWQKQLEFPRLQSQWCSTGAKGFRLQTKPLPQSLRQRKAWVIGGQEGQRGVQTFPQCLWWPLTSPIHIIPLLFRPWRSSLPREWVIAAHAFGGVVSTFHSGYQSQALLARIK